MKAEEVYAKLKKIIELDEGIGKKTEIDDTNVSNKTTYSSEKITKEIEALKSSQILEYEGTDITCENTLTSRTSDVVVKGQTYKNLDTGEIESVGDRENNKISILSKNNNSTDYINYKQDKKEILLPVEGGLKSLPNGTADTIEQRSDGVYLVQRVGMIILNNNSNISFNLANDTYVRYIITPDYPTAKTSYSGVLSNNFPSNGDTQSKESVFGYTNYGLIVCILKSKLEGTDVAGFKKWLQANPTKIYYELATPIERKLGIDNLDLEVYEGTTYITTDNVMKPVLKLKIPSNLGGVVQANTENINKLYKLVVGGSGSGDVPVSPTEIQFATDEEVEQAIQSIIDSYEQRGN